MGRLLRQVVWAAVVVIVVGQSLAQEQTGAHQSQTTPHQDAPAPEPKPEHKLLLEEITKLSSSRKFQEVLQKADELYQQARAKGDKIGEAYALCFRAIALQQLYQNAPEQLPEVASVWASAAALWREIGDGPYQVMALLGQAYCTRHESYGQAQALLKEALALAKGEVKRPLALAVALSIVWLHWDGMDQLGATEQLLQQALEIYERHAPNSLELANTLYSLGDVALSRGDLSGAERLYQQVLAIQEKLAPNSLQMAATLQALGAVAYTRGDIARAERLYRQALAIREKLAPNSLEIARTLHSLGHVAYAHGDLSGAEQLYQQALAIREKLAPNSLEVASTLHSLGHVAYARGDLSGAEQLYQQALAIREKLASNSLDVASTLHSLGNVALSRDDLSRAEQLYQQALAIREKLAPNSLDVANTIYGLGAVAYKRGDLARAEQLLQQALAIREKLAPNSLLVAKTLNNLAIVALSCGDLARAEEVLQQALAIQEKLAPNSLQMAATLQALGSVAYDRGDLVRAEQLLQQALAIREKPASGSLDVAGTLADLGTVVLSRGDLAGAEQLYQQALAIREKLASNSLDVASTLHSLGNVALSRDDLSRAEQLYQQALAIQEKFASNSLDVASTLHSLGSLAYVRGDLSGAERLLQQALAIREKLAPNSLAVASMLRDLAYLAHQQKNYPQAQQYLARAIAIYETQRSAVRDPETRTLFGEQYLNAYTLQAQIALDQNRPEQAALALERSRARSLGELLHARVLSLPDEAPQALKDLMAQQEKLQREHLLLAREQRKANANDAETARRLRAKSHELAERQRQIDQQLREKFPRYASLLNPKPPTLKQIQNSLDANTVLLYHAFADKELLIIAVSRQAVQSYRVKVDVRALEKDLIEFQRLVAKPPLERTADERASVTQLGRRLYARLINPAEASLKQARTVLLCPEGALNRLPWGALVVTVDKQGRPTYWIERVAIGVTLSADVYLQARAVRPAQRGVAIAAVSQYRNPQGLQDASVATLTRRSGSALKNLPSVKQETARLKQALNNLGVVVAQEDDATPQKVRQMAQNARVVHFACHARADHVDPLGSGLLLSPAGSDAGLLTAAEIVSRWQLRADVVMLSACETAVGRLHQYEGMYGLARAFLFAGARSVGASLWQVSDASTARLMEAFYREYARGIPKVEALRRAQVALLRDRQYADPYYWSCFVLMGAER
jgi:CHAT domain-containing protein/Tfp pilus assembly protein PilF